MRHLHSLVRLTLANVFSYAGDRSKLPELQSLCCEYELEPGKNIFLFYFLWICDANTYRACVNIWRCLFLRRCSIIHNGWLRRRTRSHRRCRHVGQRWRLHRRRTAVIARTARSTAARRTFCSRRVLGPSRRLQSAMSRAARRAHIDLAD